MKVHAKSQRDAPELELLSCPKCGCIRTRSVSTMETAFYRCDACEYVFRPPSDKPLAAVSSTRRACSKCGSPRTHVIGKSASLPLVHVQCDACGYLSTLSGRVV